MPAGPRTTGATVTPFDIDPDDAAATAKVRRQRDRLMTAMTDALLQTIAAGALEGDEQLPVYSKQIIAVAVLEVLLTGLDTMVVESPEQTDRFLDGAIAALDGKRSRPPTRH